MNWIQRKIYLYNVTFGLYMLDWWERYLFNTLIVVLMWFILYNSSKCVTDFCRREFAISKGNPRRKLRCRQHLKYDS